MSDLIKFSDIEIREDTSQGPIYMYDSMDTDEINKTNIDIHSDNDDSNNEPDFLPVKPKMVSSLATHKDFDLKEYSEFLMMLKDVREIAGIGSEPFLKTFLKPIKKDINLPQEISILPKVKQFGRLRLRAKIFSSTYSKSKAGEKAAEQIDYKAKVLNIQEVKIILKILLKVNVNYEQEQQELASKEGGEALKVEKIILNVDLDNILLLVKQLKPLVKEIKVQKLRQKDQAVAIQAQLAERSRIYE
ncbi:13055_t:CDS:2 [Funneliformis caledonium]|uniref:13055_t:CDS:1 n=1 Tax=Funneliformis caledonium TaxID=1117310 RepID=A0A9N8VG21_9GLOM|nr:13055_t:CDS:2 [Funneliformis caledonium]